jgi:hypothetical protein
MDQQIGRLVLTTSTDRDPAQALAAAQLVPVEASSATNIARPFLPLPSGSDRVLGTNLADLVTFPLNILMTPQVIPSGSVTLNRQTGYFEQEAQVVLAEEKAGEAHEPHRAVVSTCMNGQATSRRPAPW